MSAFPPHGRAGANDKPGTTFASEAAARQHPVHHRTAGYRLTLALRANRQVQSTTGNSAFNRQMVSCCSSNLPPISSPYALAARMTRMSIP